MSSRASRATRSPCLASCAAIANASTPSDAVADQPVRTARRDLAHLLDAAGRELLDRRVRRRARSESNRTGTSSPVRRASRRATKRSSPSPAPPGTTKTGAASAAWMRTRASGATGPRGAMRSEQRRGRGRFQQVRRGELDAGKLRERDEHLDGRERVAAELEEVVGDPDALAPERLREDGRHRGLRGAFRRPERPGPSRRPERRVRDPDRAGPCGPPCRTPCAAAGRERRRRPASCTRAAPWTSLHESLRSTAETGLPARSTRPGVGSRRGRRHPRRPRGSRRPRAGRPRPRRPRPDARES